MDDAATTGREAPRVGRALGIGIAVLVLLAGTVGVGLAVHAGGGADADHGPRAAAPRDRDEPTAAERDALRPTLRGRDAAPGGRSEPAEAKDVAAPEAEGPLTNEGAEELARGIRPSDSDSVAEDGTRGPSPEEVPVVQARARLGTPARWTSDQPVYSVAFTPDARFAICAGEQTFLAIRDVATGHVVGRLEGHGSGGVSDVAVSPDGTQVLSGGYDATCRLWDLASRTCLKVFPELGGTIYDVDFDASGRRGVVGGDTDGVLILDLATGKVAERFAFEGSVDGVSLSRDGRTLAAVGADGLLRVWDAPTGHLRFDVSAHKGTSGDVWHVPQSGRLVTCGEDGMIKVWEASNGALVREWKAHEARISEIALSPDGETVASGGWEGRVKHWRLEDGGLLWDHEAHTDLVVAMAFTSDGRTIASGARDGLTQLWDAATGARRALEPDALEGHSGAVLALTFAGQRLVSAGQDATIRVWDLATASWIRQVATGGVAASSIAVDAAGELLLAAGERRVWSAELASGREAWSVDLGAEVTGSVAVGLCGRTALWTVPPRGLAIHDAAGGGARDRLEGDFRALAVDPRRPEIALLRAGDHVDLVSARGAVLRTLELAGSTNPFRTLAWFPDGDTLLARRNEGARRVRASDGRTLTEYATGGEGTACAVTPDGRGVLLAWCGEIVHFDATSAKRLRRLQGTKSDVLCVAVSPDGRTIASGSADGAILLWDLPE